MTRPVLVLRPRPGADATATRARARGLEAFVAPLFEIVRRPWQPPDEPIEALLVTSANAARNLPGAIPRDLPVYAVGNATAAAMASAGFVTIVRGDGGVADLVRGAKRAGVKALLHLCGEDHTPVDPVGIAITRRIVYAADPIAPGPAFGDALARGAVALLHSARAARRFRALAGTGHRIAAISPAVLDAAGAGWAESLAAEVPSDEALLAAAARLCH
jgi:uroporphyrinogen-III synthase